MNLHEYQGKELLSTFGVRIQRGIVASTAEEAVEAAEKLNKDTGTSWWVVKAQIHAGGRGKGGGVKLAKSLDEVKSISNDILGMPSLKNCLFSSYLTSKGDRFKTIASEATCPKSGINVMSKVKLSFIPYLRSIP